MNNTKVIWPENPLRREAAPPKIVTAMEYAAELGVSKTKARLELECMVSAGKATKGKRKSAVSDRVWTVIYTIKDSNYGKPKPDNY